MYFSHALQDFAKWLKHKTQFSVNSFGPFAETWSKPVVVDRSRFSVPGEILTDEDLAALNALVVTDIRGELPLTGARRCLQESQNINHIIKHYLSIEERNSSNPLNCQVARMNPYNRITSHIYLTFGVRGHSRLFWTCKLVADGTNEGLFPVRPFQMVLELVNHAEGGHRTVGAVKTLTAMAV